MCTAVSQLFSTTDNLMDFPGLKVLFIIPPAALWEKRPSRWLGYEPAFLFAFLSTKSKTVQEKKSVFSSCDEAEGILPSCHRGTVSCIFNLTEEREPETKHDSGFHQGTYALTSFQEGGSILEKQNKVFCHQPDILSSHGEKEFTCSSVLYQKCQINNWELIWGPDHNHCLTGSPFRFLASYAYFMITRCAYRNLKASGGIFMPK